MMRIKEFFEITTAKIILFIILLILIFPLIIILTTPICIDPKIGTNFSEGEFGCHAIININLGLGGSFIISLILSYLISCFVILISKKLKTKK